MYLIYSLYRHIDIGSTIVPTWLLTVLYDRTILIFSEVETLFSDANIVDT